MPRVRLNRVAAALCVVAVIGGCDGLGPASELEVFVSASPDVATIGDTITLTGVAFNGSDESISAGWGCSFGIGFFVTDSVGTETNLYDGLAFNCPGRDNNELNPGETDIVEWDWVPEAPGRYRVQSAALLKDRRTVRSLPTEVQVFGTSGVR